MIRNFETAPFPPFTPLAGLTLNAGQRVLGGAGQPAPQRLVLWLRQGGRCFYCDDPMIIVPRYPKGAPANPRSMTIDHVCPRQQDRSRTGPQVAACFECNTRRGAMPAHEFLLLVAFRQGLLPMQYCPGDRTEQPARSALS